MSVLDGVMCSSGISSPVDGQPVLDQAVMREFGQFLDADACGAEYFDGGPGPERGFFFTGQVSPGARGGVFGPGPVAGSPVPTGAGSCRWR